MSGFHIPEIPASRIGPLPEPVRPNVLLPRLTALALSAALFGLWALVPPAPEPAHPPRARFAPLVLLTPETRAELLAADGGEPWVRMPVLFSLPTRLGFSPLASPALADAELRFLDQAPPPPFLERPAAPPAPGTDPGPVLARAAEQALTRPPSPARAAAVTPPPPIPDTAPRVDWILRDGLAGRAWADAPKPPETWTAGPAWQAEAALTVDEDGHPSSVLLTRPAPDPDVNRTLTRLLRASRFDADGGPTSGRVVIRVQPAPPPGNRHGG